MTGVAIARWVPARLGVRCGAPGCGEKIKPVTPEDMMAEVMWDDGDQSFVEAGCLGWFFNGHPDHPGIGGVGVIDHLLAELAEQEALKAGR